MTHDTTADGVEWLAKLLCDADTTSWKNTADTQTRSDVAWEDMRDSTEEIHFEGISLGRGHYRTLAQAIVNTAPPVAVTEAIRQRLEQLTCEAFQYCADHPDDPFHPDVPSFVDDMIAALSVPGEPSVEELLSRQWKVLELYSYADGRWSAYVEEADGYEGRYGEATADSLDAAIRDAVRNAKGSDG